MSELPVRRQRATYSMPFKLGLVQKSLQPGASVARLARENDINDNLLFTWRQRYRHLVDVPADDAGGNPIITDEDILPIVVEAQLPIVPGISATPALVSPRKPEQVCEITVGRAPRLRLSGNLTPAMLSALVRELKEGHR